MDQHAFFYKLLAPRQHALSRLVFEIVGSAQHLEFKTESVDGDFEQAGVALESAGQEALWEEEPAQPEGGRLALGQPAGHEFHSF